MRNNLAIFAVALLAWKAWTSADSFQRSENVTVVLQNVAYEKAQMRPRIWAERFAGGKWAEKHKLSDAKKIKLKPLATAKISQDVSGLEPGVYHFLIFNRDDFNQAPITTNTFEIK